MEKLQPFWKRVPKKIRQMIVLVIGLAVVIIGFILVPLPGPGWLIVFVGLAILASEFEVADRWKKYIQERLKKVAASATGRSKRLRKK